MINKGLRVPIWVARHDGSPPREVLFKDYLSLSGLEWEIIIFGWATAFRDSDLHDPAAMWCRSAPGLRPPKPDSAVARLARWIVS